MCNKYDTTKLYQNECFYLKVKHIHRKIACNFSLLAIFWYTQSSKPQKVWYEKSWIKVSWGIFFYFYRMCYRLIKVTHASTYIVIEDDLFWGDLPLIIRSLALVRDLDLSVRWEVSMLWMPMSSDTLSRFCLLSNNGHQMSGTSTHLFLFRPGLAALIKIASLNFRVNV